MWGKGLGGDGASPSSDITVTVTNAPSNVRTHQLRRTLTLAAALFDVVKQAKSVAATGTCENKLRFHLNEPQRSAGTLRLCGVGELVSGGELSCLLQNILLKKAEPGVRYGSVFTVRQDAAVAPGSLGLNAVQRKVRSCV